MLPRWLTGKAEGSPKGNKRRHRPHSTSQNEEIKKRRRHRQSRRKSDATRNTQKHDEHQSKGNDLRRRGRRRTRNTEPVVEGYSNPSFVPDLTWDTVSIDSSPV